MKPHKHAEVIKAWADGHTVQILCGQEWRDLTVESPEWNKAFDYRVKPAEPERVYPVCRISGDDLNEFLDSRSQLGTTYADDLELLAAYILRHACDNGQIVTREEFDRALGDRAKRDMAVARAISDCIFESEGFSFGEENLKRIIKGVTQ